MHLLSSNPIKWESLALSHPSIHIAIYQVQHCVFFRFCIFVFFFLFFAFGYISELDCRYRFNSRVQLDMIRKEQYGT